jgi:hypothetical protein
MNSLQRDLTDLEMARVDRDECPFCGVAMKDHRSTARNTTGERLYQPCPEFIQNAGNGPAKPWGDEDEEC